MSFPLRAASDYLKVLHVASENVKEEQIAERASEVIGVQYMSA